MWELKIIIGKGENAEIRRGRNFIFDNLVIKIYVYLVCDFYVFLENSFIFSIVIW